jgi:hypothetical protein
MTLAVEPESKSLSTSQKPLSGDAEHEGVSVASIAAPAPKKRHPSIIEFQDYDLIHLPRSIRKFWQVACSAKLHSPLSHFVWYCRGPELKTAVLRTKIYLLDLNNSCLFCLNPSHSGRYWNASMIHEEISWTAEKSRKKCRRLQVPSYESISSFWIPNRCHIQMNRYRRINFFAYAWFLQLSSSIQSMFTRIDSNSDKRLDINEIRIAFAAWVRSTLSLPYAVNIFWKIILQPLNLIVLILAYVLVSRAKTSSWRRWDLHFQMTPVHSFQFLPTGWLPIWCSKQRGCADNPSIW